jgi:hypothetical protein
MHTLIVVMQAKRNENFSSCSISRLLLKFIQHLIRRAGRRRQQERNETRDEAIIKTKTPKNH